MERRQLRSKYWRPELCFPPPTWQWDGASERGDKFELFATCRRKLNFWLLDRHQASLPLARRWQRRRRRRRRQRARWAGEGRAPGGATKPAPHQNPWARLAFCVNKYLFKCDINFKFWLASPLERGELLRPFCRLRERLASFRLIQFGPKNGAPARFNLFVAEAAALIRASVPLSSSRRQTSRPLTSHPPQTLHPAQVSATSNEWIRSRTGKLGSLLRASMSLSVCAFCEKSPARRAQTSPRAPLPGP